MGRKKTYDRAEVLEKAMALFWQLGYEGAHLSKLVEITGLNRFGLYKEFNGKMGLFEEALELYLARAKIHYDNCLKKDLSGLEAIETYFKSITYDPEYHGCFMINSMIERNLISENGFQQVMDLKEYIRVLFMQNIEIGQRNAEISTQTEPEIIADHLLSLDQGLSIFGIGSPDNERLQKIIAFNMDQLKAKGPT
ncbi:TetR/AcrR family transcriptional regulator [Curvivirga aplysinae]|uniref:TetR/AcrR family transcriptional regulator n=1 Tax=Curvivirga aplysinae TaxID=2529852 RepID=UPI0012BB5980|nr:TetR/AcrR family transcriptional regulator [Curvivirga aplysinae]MTI09548.1 TetR/AcrR family transcriptional regulator [Curvivirga aplysinae]